MTAEHLGIDPFELIGTPRITLKEFQSIFNEQDEEFPLVISREIYSFLAQPKRKEIQQISQMVFTELYAIQKSVLQSVQLPIEKTPTRSRGIFTIFDWMHYDRILEASNARDKIAYTILAFVPRWNAFESTEQHTKALIYKRQKESEAFQRQEAEFQRTIDEHDSSVSVYIAPFYIATSPPRQAFQSPPRKKRKIKCIYI